MNIKQMEEKTIKQKIVKWWDWAIFIFGLFIIIIDILLGLENKRLGWDSYVWFIVGAAMVLYESKKIIREFSTINNKKGYLIAILIFFALMLFWVYIKIGFGYSISLIPILIIMYLLAQRFGK